MKEQKKKDSSVCFVLWGFVKVLHKICKTENNKVHQGFVLNKTAFELLKIDQFENTDTDKMI